MRDGDELEAPRLGNGHMSRWSSNEDEDEDEDECKNVTQFVFHTCVFPGFREGFVLPLSTRMYDEEKTVYVVVWSASVLAACGFKFQAASCETENGET